ncbi:MAG: hypothetical protein SGBAC_008443 [Bacillariaceae sp.]
MLAANRLFVGRSLLKNRPNTLRCRSLSQTSDSRIEEETSGSSSSSENGEDTASTPTFPWRHEEDKLARFIPGTEEHATKGHLVSTVNTPLGNTTLNAVTTAYMFLDVPIWQLVFFSEFKAELTDSVSWAFVQGMNSLLSKLANVPTQPDASSGHDINFQKTLSKPDHESETPDLQELNFMLEKQLLDLYQSSAKNIADDIEIFLKSKPYSAELVSLYCIPYISRSNILSEPSLLTFYKKMLEKNAVEKQADLAQLRKTHLETGKMESTVIAQVLVRCKERFYVKDTASGKIVQGTDDDKEKEVPHLVRMEMIVKTVKDSSLGNFRNDHGNWIITDIDDVVGGNLVV